MHTSIIVFYIVIKLQTIKNSWSHWFTGNLECFCLSSLILISYYRQNLSDLLYSDCVIYHIYTSLVLETSELSYFFAVPDETDDHYQTLYALPQLMKNIGNQSTPCWTICIPNSIKKHYYSCSVIQQILQMHRCMIVFSPYSWCTTLTVTGRGQYSLTPQSHQKLRRLNSYQNDLYVIPKCYVTVFANSRLREVEINGTNIML